MKKTAKDSSVKKTSKSSSLKKSGKCFCELHQVPVIVALIAVILSAVYVACLMYLPKKQSETYWLERAPYGTPLNENPSEKLIRLRKNIRTTAPAPTALPHVVPVPKLID